MALIQTDKMDIGEGLEMAMVNSFMVADKWIMGYTSNWYKLPCVHHSLFMDIDRELNKTMAVLDYIYEIHKEIKPDSGIIAHVVRSSRDRHHLIIPTRFNFGELFHIYGLVVHGFSDIPSIKNWCSSVWERGYATLRLSTKGGNRLLHVTSYTRGGKKLTQVNRYHHQIIQGIKGNGVNKLPKGFKYGNRTTSKILNIYTTQESVPLLQE